MANKLLAISYALRLHKGMYYSYMFSMYYEHVFEAAEIKNCECEMTIINHRFILDCARSGVWPEHEQEAVAGVADCIDDDDIERSLGAEVVLIDSQSVLAFEERRQVEALFGEQWLSTATPTSDNVQETRLNASFDAAVSRRAVSDAADDATAAIT